MKAERVSGHWWLPSSPERRVAGTLTYDGARFPELDLMEALTDARADIDGVVVLGLTGKAEPVTVEVDFETNRPMTNTALGHSVVRQTLALRRAYVGAHLPDESDREFRRISVTFSDLLPWTGWPGPEDDWADGVHSIRYREPTEINARASWGTLRLRNSWGIDGDGVSERTIKVGAGFLCERETPASAVDWLGEVVAPLRDFISIATDRPNQVEDISLEWEERERHARFIYAPTTVELPARTAYWFDFPFTAVSIEDRFEDVLSRWFTIRGTLAPAIDLFLGTQYRPSSNLENRFLNTVGAAEAYHRRTVDPPADVLDKHKERLDRIVGQVSQRKDSDWLKWKLKYAFEPSFAERLIELADRSHDVLGPWLGESRAFAERISDARNLLVHRDPEAESEHPAGRDLLDMMEDVALIFMTCLYQDLGFPDNEIRTMLGRTRRWQFLEFRKRGWRD
jgi:hypothetical protein